MMIHASRDDLNPQHSYYIMAKVGGRWFDYLLWPYGVYGFRTADSLERAAND